MKARNLFLAAAMGMFACAPASVLAQSVGQDMKNAGHDTADAGRAIARHEKHAEPRTLQRRRFRRLWQIENGIGIGRADNEIGERPARNAPISL